jgi:predicted lipoprotein with Yx(FWY)xxD motif
LHQVAGQVEHAAPPEHRRKPETKIPGSRQLHFGARADAELRDDGHLVPAGKDLRIDSTTKRSYQMIRNRSRTLLASVAALPLIALAVAGCGSASGSVSPPTTKDGRTATIGVANESLGKILVNSRGRTLYLFQKDSGTTSECTGACAANWPPLRANGAPRIGTGANASLLASTMRSDGSRQITYNNHPLYSFVKDTKAGDTNGEGLTAFGGTWYAISPAGNQVVAQPANPGGY